MKKGLPSGLLQAVLFICVCLQNIPSVRLQEDGQQNAESTVVSDGSPQRNNDGMAKTAILVTTIVCALAVFLCFGTLGYCIYQKCCVEECII